MKKEIMQTTDLKEKQPVTLYLLFFTELWERFGFYTLQTIVILYMTIGLHMADKRANLLYAAFSSLLYLTPTIGGYIADRFLGFQRCIRLGGFLFIVAYLICALPGEHAFFFGLSILICANGFFKPNVSSIVGELYEENDPRRDGGFTLFYMGINLGSLFPPLLAGALILHFGWHAGFILAAGGMTIGQLIFLWGKKKLGTKGLYPRARGTKLALPFYFYLLLASGIVLSIALCNIAFYYAAGTNYLIEAAGVLVILVVLFFLFKEERPQQKKLFACLILIIISVGFWSVYNQTFTSLMLFANRNMEHRILGLPLDAEATQFFNPFFIIVLSPILSRLWIKLDKRHLNPSIQLKFALAVLSLGCGFFLLSFATRYWGNNGLISPWWLCGSYFMQTIGELLLSPIGLAMITVLSPKHLSGMMMGVWFFSQAASFAIGGTMANLAAIPHDLTATASLLIYHHAFMTYATLALIMAAISFALVPFLTKMINSESV